MDSQGGSTSGSSQKAAPTRPLHDCACCFISVLKGFLAHMPFPFGSFIFTVDRWTHPLTHSLEHHCLCMLAAVDDKVLAMGSFAEGCIFCTATVLSLLHTRGIVGTSACVWLKYEEVVKVDIQKAVRLANRIPLVNNFIPIICAVSSPFAIAVSDWFSKQAGERLGKSSDTDPVDDCNLGVAKEEVQTERLSTEVETPRHIVEAMRGIDAASTIETGVGDVHSEVGEDVGVDDFIKHGQTDAGEDDFAEHSSGKDVSIGDEVRAETPSLHDSILEGDLQLVDASLADGNVDDSARAAEKMPEGPLLSTREGADSVPDEGADSVLEMIESSWLRGHSLSSPPQTRLTSRTGSKGFKNPFKTFFLG